MQNLEKESHISWVSVDAELAPQFVSDLDQDVLQPPLTWKGRAKALRNRFGAWINKSGLRDSDFTVISNDCWGEALYADWSLPKRSPFIGLGMIAPCFILFVSDLERYLHQPLRFIPNSRYELLNRVRRRRGNWPMGLLGDDVEICFIHYSTEESARRAWEEGCRRINPRRIVVKFTVDKDGATPEHMAQFDRLPFTHKLLISKERHPEISCAIFTPGYVLNGAMMFHRSLRHFDCAHWLNTGEIRRFTLRVLLNKLIYIRGV